MEIKQLIAQYKFDKSIYDNFIPEFNEGYINYEIVDEYLDTDDIVTLRTETMMLMSYDAEPDEYGVLTTEHEIESLNTFSVENIITRSIYSNELPAFISFNNDGKSALLEINHLNVNNITDMQYMFYGCDNLINVNSSDWDTSNITDMSYAFTACVSLASIDVRNWRTSNVTSTYAMFDSCISLTSLDLSGWNTSNMINMNSMFSGCTSLISLDLSNWVLNDADIGYMCSRCARLTTIKLNNWNFNKPNWLSSTFNSCTNLNLVYMKNSNVKSVNNIISLLPTRTTDSPGSLNVSGIDDISQVNITTAESKFWNVTNEEPEETKQLVAQYKFTNSSDVIPIFNEGFSYTIEDIVDGETTTRIIKSAEFPTAISFENIAQLLEVYYLETSNMTSAYNLFYNCSNLIYVDLNHSDFSNIETIERMFTSCTKLVTIDGLNDLNVSKVHNMGGIFSDCRKLKEINVSNWDVSKVTNFGAVFRRCYEITSLDINSWDTSSAVLMSGMFTSCTKLTSMDISNWNMNNVTTVNQMFYGCSKLTSVNLYKHLNNGVDTLYLFGNCSLLNNVEIYNSNYDTVNMIISALPTKTNTAPGILNISGIDDISQVNTTTAQTKYWNLVNEVPEKINFLRIGDTIINNIYIGDSQVLKIYLGTVLVYETSFK